MFASISNRPIIRARITIPEFGIWHGDATIDSGAGALTGDVSVVIGNLTLAGHAFRSGPFVGRVDVRLVGGHGGWSQPVPAQGYYEPSGVPVSHVLGDVAQACGETLVLAADSRPWTRYVRETMPGARALNQILGQTWWIDVDGTTKNAPRATSPITSPFQVEKYDPATGMFTIALTGLALADWMPGRTFTSPTVTEVQTISSVTIIIGESSVTLEVLTGTEDRLTADFLSLVRETMPSLTFLGVYEYSVSSAEPGSCEALPVDPSIGLPPLTNMAETFPMMAATLTPGDLIRVQFVNGSPSRPEVCSAPDTSTEVDIAAHALAVKIASAGGITSIGSLPLPIATALGTTDSVAVLAAFDAALASAAAPLVPPGSGGSPANPLETSFNTFAAALVTAAATVVTDLAAAVAEIPTTETEAT